MTRKHERRTHCISIRLNDAELEEMNARNTTGLSKGRYGREAILNQLPPTIPPINIEAWTALARASANLNQIARYLNYEQQVEINEIKNTLADFRNALIRAAS